MNDTSSSEQEPHAVDTDAAEPDAEELRAAMEAELQRLRVDDVLAQSVVSLINLGGRRLGLAKGSEGERDLEQARIAIDAVRALMPVLETLPALAGDISPIRDAVASLQMGYARLAGTGAADGTPASQAPPAESPPAAGSGPAPSSGRLWVPGQ